MCVSISMYKCVQLRVFSKIFSNHCTAISLYCNHFYRISYQSSMRTFVSESKLLKIVSLDPQKRLPVTSNRRINTAVLSTIGLHSNTLKEEHKWILKIPEDALKEKHKLIKYMNFTKVEHSIPFYKLSPRTLLSILYCIQSDDRKGFCKNRLYYLSSRLQYDPTELSERISKRPFVYSLSFDWIEKSLNVLLEMEISSSRIVKDLHVIKYHHRTIRKRLESVKATGRNDLSPWMVRCTEDILQRSIQITQDTKTILGENRTLEGYLAERLRTSPDFIRVLRSRVPSLPSMRVMKVKSCLDLLFAEGFTETEVLHRPSVLAHSVKTIKSRLDTLRSLGLGSRNLSLLLKTEKEFKKFCNNFSKKNKDI